MKVKINSLDVDMQVKNRGIEFQVRSSDGDKHLGDCIINRKGLTWCRGRTRRQTGTRISWRKFIELAEQQ